MKAKKWVMVKRFEGFPEDSDFQLVEEELPALAEGDVLFEAVYLSVDPYMRVYMRSSPEGSVMIGHQLSRVVESKNVEFPLGSLYYCRTGWRSHMVYNPNQASNQDPFEAPVRATDIGQLPQSFLLGVLGMPGCTAYFGLLRLCDPQPGETVLVNGAAGAVGCVVGQIAKIKGCTVIGYAGSDEKCAWLRELGFDHAFNYKTCDLDATLKQAAPGGIDCFFDNVSITHVISRGRGDFTATVVEHHMKEYGRIASCGFISAYNAKETPKGPYPYGPFILKQLKLEGFLVHRWRSEYPKAVKEMLQWMQEGKLKYSEHVTQGFENMPQAFMGMLRGENLGKAIVKV